MNEDANQELHQMYQERQQRCELAIERAELGIATDEDFDILRFECGLTKHPSPTQEISNELDSFFGELKLSLNNLNIRK
jgi:lipopolysaccharide biosynthesis regulator YciM